MHKQTTPASAERQVEYREIPGHPGYRAGDDGSIWSEWQQQGKDWHRSGQWHQRRQWTNRRGYRMVCFSRGANRFVHRLVLFAFVGPRPPGMLCRHLDGNPSNNRLENLCWGTGQENEADKERHGRTARGDRHGSHTHPERWARGERHGSRTKPGRIPRGEANSMARLTEDTVREIRRLHAEGGWTCRQLGERFGVHRDTVRFVVLRRTWKHVD